MGYSDIAHNGLIVLAALAACGLIVAFVAMDRNATLADREQFRPMRVYAARAALSRWSWIAAYASVVLAAALLSLLIGA